MRNVLGTIGFAAIVGGVGMVSLPWSLIVGGSILFASSAVGQIIDNFVVRK